MSDSISMALAAINGLFLFLFFWQLRRLEKNGIDSKEISSELTSTRQELFNQVNQILQTTLNELATFRNEQQQNLDRFGERFQTGLQEMQKSNEKKLEQMRETVDEKLHKTLESRLGRSFQQVSKRLEEVHKGLGEMQTLASGVGDLKKVLTNVKTRGLLGEFQLGQILEQILTPDQYERDVRTKKRGQQHVEFAVKLPGHEADQPIWLPIDAKFPLKDYEELLETYEQANPELIDEKKRALARKLKTFAKEIATKYLDPPATTDFALLFLPIEGLYAEVLRHPDLFETLQRDFRVTVVGPTTLAALLNSLQMGFRTLAIEKRSSEVWTVLSHVKTEFRSFASTLDRAQDRISKTSEDLDKLIGVRTRQIERRLSSVQEIPDSHSPPQIIAELSDPN